jgi:hypothetical protein
VNDTNGTGNRIPGNLSTGTLRGKLQDDIAQAESLKRQVDNTRSDAEIRNFQLDSQIASAQRSLAGLNQHARDGGNDLWPDEHGPRS